jgi:hypothetical protein
VDSSKSSFRFKKEGLRKGIGAVKANPKRSSKSKIVKLFLFMLLNYKEFRQKGVRLRSLTSKSLQR